MDKLRGYVEELNADLGQLPSRGPCSRYELPDEGFKGRLELKFLDGVSRGVACNLDSPGGWQPGGCRLVLACMRAEVVVAERCWARLGCWGRSGGWGPVSGAAASWWHGASL